jgi:thiosulfate/3-mercaptopyruvate sulfurtransferase
MSLFDDSRKLFVLIVGLALTIACAGPQPQPDQATSAEQLPPIDTLVTTEWLSRHLDDPDLVVLDCTVRVEIGEDGSFQVTSGREDYDGGHIPSAGFADLLGDLSDSDSSLRFAVPTPEQFSAAMGALGVGDDSRVVLYDSRGSAWAARVWWMLRWIGFDRAAVLDGGLQAWTAEERPLSTEPADRPAKELTVAFRPDLIADREEVLAAIDDNAVRLIDALPAESYRGEMPLYDRSGHIPGAANIPAASLLDESGRYLPHDELAGMFDGDRNARVITYCGGGISASSVAFIMTRLGFTDVAVYTASLQEWAADSENPLVVTPEENSDLPKQGE